MTAYSPSALRELIKNIAYKAIETDLYMLPTTGWDGSAEEGFYGAAWDGNLPPVTSGPTGPTRLKWHPPTFTSSAAMPPGARKIGDGSDAAGQPYIEYEVDAWESIYSPWIERIESAFAGWDEICEPDDFEGPIDSMRAAVSALTPLPEGPGSTDEDGEFSTTYADVELETALGTMDSFIGASTEGANQGLLIYAFRQGYGPDRIRSIMSNQGQAAIVLGITLLGEQRIWEGAQQDIMAIADKALESMRPGGAGGDAIDLKVVKAFAGLVKSFVPGPVATAIDVGTAALDLVDAVAPPEPEPVDAVQLSGYTCDEVASSMEELISTLEQKVFDQEYELAYTTLQGLLDYMHGDDAAVQFHIHPKDGIDTDLAEAEALDVKVEYLRKIGYKLVPGVAAYMGHAAEDALAANKSGIWARSNQIGLGDSGPYAKWSEVQGQFDAVTTGSGSELVEAGRLLAIGAGYIEDTDNDSQQALDGVRDDLDRGTYGWDNSVPVVPTGPGGMYAGGANRPV